MIEAEKNNKTIAYNRHARFDYFIDESIECGIELLGSEVKAIKVGKLSFVDSYGKIENDELWLVGLHITQYEFANRFNHNPDRLKRLLAHKQEIKRFKRKTLEKGLTLIPIKFYLKKGLIKVEIGLCKGKKKYDKRESIKKRDQQRDMAKEFKFK